MLGSLNEAKVSTEKRCVYRRSIFVASDLLFILDPPINEIPEHTKIPLCPPRVLCAKDVDVFS